jgi:hypothetical protein
MKHITDIVSAMPGCTRELAVEAAEGYLPASGHYGPLDRAIARGLIVADWPDRYHVRLFTTGAARRIWYLRRELLEPGIAAGRVQYIHAEIDELQAAQAQTWGGQLRALLKVAGHSDAADQGQAGGPVRRTRRTSYGSVEFDRLRRRDRFPAKAGMNSQPAIAPKQAELIARITSPR